MLSFNLRSSSGISGADGAGGGGSGASGSGIVGSRSKKRAAAAAARQSVINLFGDKALDMDSANCHRCGKPFGRLRKRQFCNLCGAVVCSTCHQFQLPALAGTVKSSSSSQSPVEDKVLPQLQCDVCGICHAVVRRHQARRRMTRARQQAQQHAHCQFHETVSEVRAEVEARWPEFLELVTSLSEEPDDRRSFYEVKRAKILVQELAPLFQDLEEGLAMLPKLPVRTEGERILLTRVRSSLAMYLQSRLPQWRMFGKQVVGMPMPPDPDLVQEQRELEQKLAQEKQARLNQKKQRQRSKRRTGDGNGGDQCDDDGGLADAYDDGSGPGLESHDGTSDVHVEILAVNPAVASLQGSRLEINGEGFQGGCRVAIGGKPVAASAVRRLDPETVMIRRTPPFDCQGVQPITVSNPDGSSHTLNDVLFVFPDYVEDERAVVLFDRKWNGESTVAAANDAATLSGGGAAAVAANRADPVVASGPPTVSSFTPSMSPLAGAEVSMVVENLTPSQVDGMTVEVEQRLVSHTVVSYQFPLCTIEFTTPRFSQEGLKTVRLRASDDTVLIQLDDVLMYCDVQIDPRHLKKGPTSPTTSRPSTAASAATASAPDSAFDLSDLNEIDFMLNETEQQLSTPPTTTTTTTTTNQSIPQQQQQQQQQIALSTSPNFRSGEELLLKQPRRKWG